MSVVSVVVWECVLLLAAGGCQVAEKRPVALHAIMMRIADIPSHGGNDMTTRYWKMSHDFQGTIGGELKIVKTVSRSHCI